MNRRVRNDRKLRPVIFFQDNNVGCDRGGNGGVTEVGVDCGGRGDGSKLILQPAVPTTAKSVATSVLTKPEQRRNVDKTERFVVILFKFLIN